MNEEKSSAPPGASGSEREQRARCLFTVAELEEIAQRMADLAAHRYFQHSDSRRSRWGAIAVRAQEEIYRRRKARAAALSDPDHRPSAEGEDVSENPSTEQSVSGDPRAK